LQNDRAALSAGFLKAVRLIMLVSCPLYLGMAVTAAPLVEVVMGPKWVEASPLVAVLALAMPVMTLQILFHPALNALGLPQITLRNSIFGAVLMPSVYLYAVQYGSVGLAWGWLVALPVLLAFTVYQAKPHVGFTIGGLFAAVLPGMSAALVMGALVWLVDRLLPPLPALPHLAILVATGGLVYTGLLWFGARQTFMEVVNLVIKRKPPEPVTL
jgi:O-antigen/teichoic acid export membrane protein